MTTSHKKPRVVSLGKLQNIDEAYLSAFKKDYNFSSLEAYNHDQTRELLPKDIGTNGPIDAFIVRMGTPPYEPFDESLLGPLVPSCRIIASASAGYNEFDIDWMAKRGMWFCNTVDAVAEATADMTIFLLLATVRNTSAAEKGAREGRWRGTGLVPARDPSGLVLGIVGMGAIGKYLAKKARVFGLKVKYHNRHRLPEDVEKEYDATYSPTLHHLLASSDIISLNCPLNAETTNLISHAEFDAMKDGTFLINTARGAVIDETAFKAALESGRIARAGLDVFCHEPNVDTYFLESEKVVVQPHMGGLTDAAFQRAERECLENVRAYFEKGKPNSGVNEPVERG